MIITNQPHIYAHSKDEWIIAWDDFIPFVAHGLHYDLFYSHMLPNIITIIVENSDDNVYIDCDDESKFDMFSYFVPYIQFKHFHCHPSKLQTSEFIK